MHGTTCSGSTCPANEYGAILNFKSPDGYTIRQGDLLTWRQYENGAFGGMHTWFTDATSADQVALDTDGQLIDADQTMNTWHERVVDLSNYAGKTIVGIDPWKSPTSAAGTWDLYFGDINLVSTDGTSIPLYNRSLTSLHAVAASGVTDFYGITEKYFNETNPLASTTYYSGDQIGSTRVVTDSGGWPVSSDVYYPFGQEAIPTADNNHYKFTGKERDTESGLDYFGARYYSSTMGRWMSPDWADKPEAVPYSQLDNPQSLNLYGYVNNNPLSKADKDGHCPWCVLATVGGAALGGAEEGGALGSLGGPVGAGIGIVAGALGGGILAYEHFHQDAPASGTEQGRDAQGKFLPKQAGQTAPGADAEKDGLKAEGATKTGTTLPGTTHKVDGTVTDTGQKVDIKSGATVGNTKQLQATGDAARAATGQPLLVPTTNPNVHVTAPAAANPNLEIRPVKQPQQ
jgi:RHS repeat-associated protein